MKKISFLLAIGLLSCGTAKEKKTQPKTVSAESPSVEIATPNDQSRPQRQSETKNIEGTVRLNKGGCPVVIELIDGDLYAEVAPLNLEQKFHVEGLKITFSYKANDVKLSQSCTADYVVTLWDVALK